MNDLINTLSSAIHSVYINDASVKKKNKVDVGMDLLEKVEAVAQQLKDSPATITSEDVEKLRLCVEELESINPAISRTALSKLNRLISTAMQQEMQSLHAEIEAPVFVETVIPTPAATPTPTPDRVYGVSEDEIKEILQAPELPQLRKSELFEKIEKQFQRELKEVGSLQDELDEMIKSLGLEPSDFSPTGLKVLVSLLFAIKLEGLPPSYRSTMTSFLNDKLVSDAIEKCKRQPGYEQQAKALEDAFFLKLGMSIPPEDATKGTIPLRDLLFILSIMTNKDGRPARKINAKINVMINKQFDSLCTELETIQASGISNDAIRDKAFKLMGILRYLSDGLAYDEAEHFTRWDEIDKKYKKILEIKAGGGKTVDDIIAEVFEDFTFLIEEGIIQYRQNKPGKALSIEECTRMAYGKTVEQVEAKKEENRKQVVKLIADYAKEIQSGAPLTIEMIQELHRVNNKGIVPERTSQMRKGDEGGVSFFARQGVPSKDVEQAVTPLIEGINSQITKRHSLKGIWSIIVAKFHNDFLDIHPFKDRNGSTSLLLAELLMAVGGNYKPTPKRDKNYYKTLTKILANPVAVAIVAYEQFRIKHVPGSYELKTPSKT